MAGEINPIKRSPQLSPLSREHHEGLLFVWKIRQGIRYGIEADRIAAFCQWFWSQHLAPHFQKEEKVVPSVLSTANENVQRMFAEHEAIRQRLTQVEREADYASLESLAQTVYDHIRFEERVLFNELEEAASPEQWLRIAEALNKEQETGDNWKDTFWLL